MSLMSSFKVGLLLGFGMGTGLGGVSLCGAAVPPPTWPPQTAVGRYQAAFEAQLGRPLGTAVILGGSDGIGGGFASSLARLGFDVVIVARGKDKLQAKKVELERDSGRKVVAIPADLGERASVQAVLDGIPPDMRDQVSLVVGAAGAEYADDASPEQIKKMRDIKREVTPELIRKLTGRMKSRGATAPRAGKVVLISSVSGKFELPHRRQYSASNKDYAAFGERLAREVSPRGIDVSVVFPGPVDTPGLQEIFRDTRVGLRAINRWSPPVPVPDLVMASLEGVLRGEAEILPPGAVRDLAYLSVYGLWGMVPGVSCVQDNLFKFLLEKRSKR